MGFEGICLPENHSAPRVCGQKWFVWQNQDKAALHLPKWRASRYLRSNSTRPFTEKTMFPFRKTPPSKLEVAKKSVTYAAHAIADVVPTDVIEEKFDDLKKAAVAVALHAAQVAHHASEVASQKLEDLQHAASAFGETASVAAHRASDSAQQASESAQATAAAKAKAAREAALAAKESVLTTRDALQDRAATLLDTATALKSSLQERASHDLEAGKAGALTAKAAASKAAQQGADALGDKSDAVKAKFAGKKADVEEKIAAVQIPEIQDGHIQVEYTDTSSKWGWILLGLAVGAALALLFAPTSGRRSRAAIKDRLDKVSDGAVDAATSTSDKVVDIAHRVEGIAHKVEAKIASDSEGDDDSIIADRVRSVLGHHEVAKHIERINVDSADGVITLRGPIVDVATQDTIIAVVRTVAGVKDVISDFLTDEAPADPATYAS
jgi:gas vesicle protein